MCGKIFGHASHLKDHSIVHLDVKQFYCETCGKRFKHKRACKLHMKHFCKGNPHFPVAHCLVHYLSLSLFDES